MVNAMKEDANLRELNNLLFHDGCPFHQGTS